MGAMSRNTSAVSADAVVPVNSLVSAGAVVSADWALRAAVLLAATPIAVPLMMFYDLMLVFVALVWLSLVPAKDGALWRVPLMAAAFLGPLLSGNLSTESHWMLAFVTAALAFGLTIAMAWRARRDCYRRGMTLYWTAGSGAAVRVV